MSSASNKEVLRRSHINQQQLVISVNDPRNNEMFLRTYPNTVIVEESNKLYKTPTNLDSVEKSKPDTQVTFRESTIVPLLVRDDSARQSLQNQIYIDNIVDEALNGKNSALDIDSDTIVNTQEFIFHELASEHYDAYVDLDVYSDVNNYPVRNGAVPEITQDILPPSDIIIDEQSFVLQKDAKDGSVSFKVSVNFEGGTELEDYDIIVTPIFPA